MQSHNTKPPSEETAYDRLKSSAQWNNDDMKSRYVKHGDLRAVLAELEQLRTVVGKDFQRKHTSREARYLLAKEVLQEAFDGLRGLSESEVSENTKVINRLCDRTADAITVLNFYDDDRC